MLLPDSVFQSCNTCLFVWVVLTAATASPSASSSNDVDLVDQPCHLPDPSSGHASLSYGETQHSHPVYISGGDVEAKVIGRSPETRFCALLMGIRREANVEKGREQAKQPSNIWDANSSRQWAGQDPPEQREVEDRHHSRYPGSPCAVAGPDWRPNASASRCRHVVVSHSSSTAVPPGWDSHHS